MTGMQMTGMQMTGMQMTGMQMTGTTSTRRRNVSITLAATTLSALLMFLYRHLEHVAMRQVVPFYEPLIDQFTGVFGAVALFPIVQRLARRYPIRRRSWVVNVPLHAAALLAFSAAHTTLNWISRELLYALLRLGNYDYGIMSVRYLMELPIDVIIYTLFVCGVWLLDDLAAERAAVLRSAQLESQLREAQLRGLRLQLQPHFLFNALNTISSTMYDDPRAADTMLSRLAELLRVSLRTSQTQEVPLSAELHALEHYVALLRARFGERLSYHVEVEDDLARALVPSLIVQPLVENAVRHGNLSRLGTGRIVVRAVRVAGDGGHAERGQTRERLRIEVEDDGPGPDAGVEAIANGKGIGLTGTIERLRLLYGDAHRFELRLPREAGQGFVVGFELPLRLAEDARDGRDREDTAREGDAACAS